MNDMPDFHDGFFDGLRISDPKMVHVFLRTADKRPFTLVLHGVKLMNVSNVRQGNIILDLVLLNAQQVTAAHIEELYEVVGVQRIEQVERLLASARQEGLSVLDMSASYGAEGIALFSRAEFRANHIGSE